MMTLEEIRDRKKVLRLTTKQLSEISGIPVGTLQKILSGETKQPRYQTMETLARVLTEAEGGGVLAKDATYGAYGGVSLAAEKLKHIRMTGPYRLKDYLALPGDIRMELIDGVFFDMAAPTTIHQRIGYQISMVLGNFIDANKGKCVPFTAPTDVQLDMDDKTIVEPDVFVVCDREKIRRERIYGAPDLVIEILSPSTAEKDQRLKLYKYIDAGVREYWIVDPDRKQVTVYRIDPALENGTCGFACVYSFDDKIPIAIFDEQCLIDMAEIYERVRFLYEE